LPVPQYRLQLPDGTIVFLDFAYPEVKLAIEADSYLWHASLADWQRDRGRNGEVIALGWAILPITWDTVRFHRERAAGLVARALASRAA
jgi:very-short-patch-repair endonuclease